MTREITIRCSNCFTVANVTVGIFSTSTMIVPITKIAIINDINPNAGVISDPLISKIIVTNLEQSCLDWPSLV